jgi:hypothetical protein
MTNTLVEIVKTTHKASVQVGNKKKRIELIAGESANPVYFEDNSKKEVVVQCHNDKYFLTEKDQEATCTSCKTEWSRYSRKQKIVVSAFKPEEEYGF